MVRADVRLIDAVPDCDGVQLGDIDADGTVDVLASDGVGGNVFWYRQDGGPERWTRHAISSGHGEIEGNDLADVDADGQLEAISLDQARGEVLLHKPGSGGPTGRWATAVIQADRPYLQDSMAVDLDGDGRDELLYTWEGDRPGNGGVSRLKLTGDDPLDPAHWDDRLLARHEGAWWLAPRRLDLRGTGRATDLVFSARATRGRNPGCRPGVFWLEPTAGPGEWTGHVIDDRLAHPLHVAVGDLSGDGHGQDVVVGDFTGRELCWYRRSTGFARHVLPLPAPGHAVFNTAVGRVSGGRRDDILIALQDVGVFLYVHREGRYQPELLFEVGRHPLDDRVLWHDLDGDGADEAVIADSGGDRLLWLDFV